METKIPQTFNVKYGDTTYPLDLDITEYSTKKKITLELKVVFPHKYPKTNYTNVQSLVSYLLIRCDIAKKILSVDSFYVYNNKETFKKLITVGLETFNTKGLGKYMLCRAVQYFLQKEWVDKTSTVTLTAAGNECFHKIETYEECMDIFKDYPEQLFNFLSVHCRSLLNHKLQTSEYMDSRYYEKHKSKIDPTVRDILKEETTRNEQLLTLLKEWACNIKTNLKLVEYYKKYGFKEDQRQDYNYPFYVNMSSSVDSILSECTKDVQEKSSSNTEISSVSPFRPRRKLSKRAKKSSFKSAQKRRKSKNKRSPKPRRR
jgi:hypothetical protein